MARFPKPEAEIVALAQAMETGFGDNVAVYPAPPVVPLDLAVLITAYNDNKNVVIAAQAAAEQATADKDDSLDDLVDAMKTDIRYAENTVDFDDDKLKLIGWAGRKASLPLQPPGQTRLLEAPRQGAGWVFLDWKKPSEGGLVSAYKVMRRERPDGPWSEIATAVISEATLRSEEHTSELHHTDISRMPSSA